MVMDGRILSPGISPQPEMGSQSSQMPNTSTSSGPSRKEGMQMPIMAVDMGM